MDLLFHGNKSNLHSLQPLRSYGGKRPHGIRDKGLCYLVCYAATPPALPFHQERMQVVRSKQAVKIRGSATFHGVMVHTRRCSLT